MWVRIPPGLLQIICTKIFYATRKMRQDVAHTSFPACHAVKRLGAKQGWPAMHKALNVSQAYQDSIYGTAAWRLSIRVRAGHNRDCEENMDYIGSILEFRKRGKTTLTAPDFPRLS
jgi:hypothetical protein